MHRAAPGRPPCGEMQRMGLRSAMLVESGTSNESEGADSLNRFDLFECALALILDGIF